MRTRSMLSVAVLALFAAAHPGLVQADRDDRGPPAGTQLARSDYGRDHDHRGGYPPGWHGDIHHFDRHDMDLWRGGHWYHGDHDGRLGWWWIVGALWYFYPSPVYPYPSPYVPPVVTAPPSPPATTYYYYCRNPPGYYPYVAECPGGWQLVPTTPP